jgi:hypothetical protein
MTTRIKVWSPCTDPPGMQLRLRSLAIRAFVSLSAWLPGVSRNRLSDAAVRR